MINFILIAVIVIAFLMPTAGLNQLELEVITAVCIFYITGSAVKDYLDRKKRA